DKGTGPAITGTFDGVAEGALLMVNDRAFQFSYQGGNGNDFVAVFKNTLPVLGVIGDQTVDEGSMLSFTATATDPDLPAQALTFSLIGAPDGAAINATTGAFSWTPTEAQGPGTFTFTVRVTDDGSPNLSDEESITVTVNEVNAT